MVAAVPAPFSFCLRIKAPSIFPGRSFYSHIAYVWLWILLDTQPRTTGIYRLLRLIPQSPFTPPPFGLSIFLFSLYNRTEPVPADVPFYVITPSLNLINALVFTI